MFAWIRWKGIPPLSTTHKRSPITRKQRRTSQKFLRESEPQHTPLIFSPPSGIVSMLTRSLSLLPSAVLTGFIAFHQPSSGSQTPTKSHQIRPHTTASTGRKKSVPNLSLSRTHPFVNVVQVAHDEGLFQLLSIEIHILLQTVLCQLRTHQPQFDQSPSTPSPTKKPRTTTPSTETGKKGAQECKICKSKPKKTGSEKTIPTTLLQTLATARTMLQKVTVEMKATKRNVMETDIHIVEPTQSGSEETSKNTKTKSNTFDLLHSALLLLIKAARPILLVHPSLSNSDPVLFSALPTSRSSSFVRPSVNFGRAENPLSPRDISVNLVLHRANSGDDSSSPHTSSSYSLRRRMSDNSRQRSSGSPQRSRSSSYSMSEDSDELRLQFSPLATLPDEFDPFDASVTQTMTQLLSKDDLEHSIFTPKQTKATGSMSSRKRSAVASPGTPGGLSFGTIHSGNALPPVRFGAETNEMNGVNETPWKSQATAAATAATPISDGPTELKRHSIAGTRPHPSHTQKKLLTRQSSAQLGSPSTTFPNTSPKQTVEIRSRPFTTSTVSRIPSQKTRSTTMSASTTKLVGAPMSSVVVSFGTDLHSASTANLTSSLPTLQTINTGQAEDGQTVSTARGSKRAPLPKRS